MYKRQSYNGSLIFDEEINDTMPVSSGSRRSEGIKLVNSEYPAFVTVNHDTDREDNRDNPDSVVPPSELNIVQSVFSTIKQSDIIPILPDSTEKHPFAVDAHSMGVGDINGDGLDVNILSEANVSRADTVLAITDDDKTNMLAAVRAKAQGCKMAIVLINDPTLVPLMQPLGIDAYINPRATTVSSILRHIRHGRVKGVYAIGDAEAEILEAEVLSTSPIAGQKIRDIEFPESVLIGGLLKNGEFIKPSGGTLIEEGDTIALFTMAEDIPEVERLLQVSIDFF